jgi:hypothetical protein
MAEKQKPAPKVVKAAAKGIKKPKTVTKKNVKSMSARILDDQKNDPLPHKKAPTKKKHPKTGIKRALHDIKKAAAAKKTRKSAPKHARKG